MPIDLSIIILNYNTADWLENVLSSIAKYPQKIKLEVIVVDNASTDGSANLIESEFPQVKLLPLPKNGGFAKGNNAGIKIAKGRYVMLLNSDTEFTPHTDLRSMVEMMDDLPEVGVMTPKLTLADGSLDLASHRGEPTPWASFTYFTKLEQFFPNLPLFSQYHQSWKDFSKTHEIEACSGASMMVRSSALKKVGLLDEQFFMYAEDLDWCKRFREAGYKVIYFADSVIIHHKYKSGIAKDKLSKKIFPTTHNPQPTTYHFWETMKQYYEKHYSSSFVSKKMIHLGVDVIKKLKRKR